MAGNNRNGVVELDFGDATHRFRLALGQLEELQEKTGVGPFVLLRRLLGGDWMTTDVRETLRIGLIGGGMEPLAALALVRRYVDDRHDWLAHAVLARLVMMAALTGSAEEEPGNGDAPADVTEAPDFQMGVSPSELSTEPPPPSE